MTADQVEALGPEFTAFLRPFERFFDNREDRPALPRRTPAGCFPTCRGRRPSRSPSSGRHGAPEPATVSQGVSVGPRRPHRCRSTDLPGRGRRPAARSGGDGRHHRRDQRGQEGRQDARRAAAVPRLRGQGRRTASSPSTWPWPAAASRPCSTANCSCPSRGTPTATAAGKPTSPTTCGIGRSGGSV